MKLIFDYKFRFYTSKMNEICLHCHLLYFSSIILRFGQCAATIIKNSFQGMYEETATQNSIKDTVLLWCWCSLIMYAWQSWWEITWYILLRIKGQIKPKAVWARRRFSQKMNEWICFVCYENQKSNLQRSNLLSVLSDL